MDVIVIPSSADWCRLFDRVAEAAVACDQVRDRYARVARRRRRASAELPARLVRIYRGRVGWYARSDVKESASWDYSWRVSDAIEKANEWKGLAVQAELLMIRLGEYIKEPTQIVVTGEDFTLLERIENDARKFGYLGAE